MRNKRLCRNSRICLSFPVVYGIVWPVVGDQHPKIRRNIFDESKEVDYVYLLVIKNIVSKFYEINIAFPIAFPIQPATFGSARSWNAC